MLSKLKIKAAAALFCFAKVSILCRFNTSADALFVNRLKTKSSAPVRSRFTDFKPTRFNRKFSTVLRGGSMSSLKLTTFDNGPLWQSASIIGGANLLGLALSVLTTSHYHVDLLGTGAFALSVIPQLLDPSSNGRIKLSATFVAVWATKLASFLFYRVIKNKHDARLDGTLSTVSGCSEY